MKKETWKTIIQIVVSILTAAQTFTQYTTTEQQPWQTKGNVKCQMSMEVFILMLLGLTFTVQAQNKQKGVGKM